MTLMIYVQCDGDKIIPIEVEYMATIQDVLDELKRAEEEHKNHQLYYMGEGPLGATDILADLGINSESVLNYQLYASWKPTEEEMYEAIEGYDQMEIYHPDGDRDIRYWDTSDITDMSYLFESVDNFSQDIGGWDTDMGGMSLEADNFNSDIKKMEYLECGGYGGVCSGKLQVLMLTLGSGILQK